MKKLRLNRKPLLLTLAAVLIGGGGVLAYSIANNNSSSPSSPAIVNPKKADTPDQINYGPPTDQEKAVGDNNKSAVINRQNIDSSPAPSSSKRSVTPVITSPSPQSGSTITITGFVQGVVEDGGTCTATLTQSGKPPVTATSQGVENASTTNCPLISIDKSKLSTGTWQVTLNYSSATAQGTSTRTLEIK